MSWDNVTGVNDFKIWTDNPDTTQAYLFANGSHQVKLNARISFSGSSADLVGPTEEEVKAALSLIDYTTGADLSHLNVVDKGEYTSVYLQDIPMAVKPIPDVAPDEVSLFFTPTYEFEFYVSSDSTINSNYASESVALLVSYIDSSGTQKTFTSASGGKESYVTVTVYPPKKYGVAGSASTPVIIELKDDKLPYTYDYSHRVDDLTVSAWSLRIDDSYFRIVKFQAASGVQSNEPFYRHGKNVQSGGIAYDEDWETKETFLPTENKVNQGHLAYDSTLEIIYDDAEKYFFKITVTVHQEANEIIFINFYAVILPPSDSGFDNKTDTASLSAYDQFGNKFTVEVSNNGSGLQINNVT